MRHRLYHRIFLSMFGFVVLALVLAALAGHLLLSEVVRTHLSSHLLAVGARVARQLPPPERPNGELQAALEQACGSIPLHAAVWSRDGERLAYTTVDLPMPEAGLSEWRWLGPRRGTAIAMPLHDARVLVLQPRRLPRPGSFVASLLVLAGLLAAASYPVARLVTRRLEILETGVRRLGEGDLSTRVTIGGRDEVASLATSFNRAAERLQRLVEAQRRVLASASHELRSPLARLRVALELMRESRPAAVVDQAVAEVEELDTLVEELLLAGRLEVQPPLVPAEPVDVTALLQAEAARTGAAVAGAPAWLRADPRMIRVLLRNLLENARRHGGGSAVEAGVEAVPSAPPGVRVWVADRGPGVAEADRERIFEPFFRPADHSEGRDGGIGLGLFLVRSIARRLGGDAVCLPREGGGSRFVVTLAPAPTSPPA
ncbi:MAG: sensor histidine kinase [Acidobacteriota bacterium]